MAEWGIPFHVIENEWTQRQFDLFTSRLVERLENQHQAQRRAQNGTGRPAMLVDAIRQGGV